MLLLVLKLTLTPTLIAVASLIGRRWGPTVSGWLVGLPFTSAPIVYFLVVSHGPAFATTTAIGTLAGVFSQTAFCLTMAWLGLRRGWPVALGGGCLAFFAVTFGLLRLPLTATPAFALALVALALALCLMPTGVSSLPWILTLRHAPSSHAGATPSPERNQTLPWWDLPARMGIAALFVVILTGASSALGAQFTGLLAPFPLYASILAVFAHRQHGPLAMIGTVRGLLLGLFAFSAFFFIVATLLIPLGAPLAFTLALLTALAIQGCSLWALRWAAQRSASESTALTSIK